MAAATGRVSGLNDKEAAAARRRGMLVIAHYLANPASLHYTQGPRRWDIVDDLDPTHNRWPAYGDCSSTATGIVKYALKPYTGKDTVNGNGWQYGYTGTILTHGKVVKHQYSWKILDLIVYGRPGTTGEHVAVHMGGGWVFSHGSESGPYKLRWNYRSDFMGTRRPI